MNKDCVQCGSSYRARKKGQRFCSFGCRDEHKRGNSKYDVQWVMDNLGKKNVQEMAEHFGVSPDAFKKQVYLWRQAGYVIEDFRKLRQRRERVRPAALPRKKRTKTITKPDKAMAGTKNKNYAANKQAKKRTNEVRFKNRVQDMSTKKRVYIPAQRLHVYVDIAADAAAVEQKYTRHREDELRGHYMRRGVLL